LCLSHISAFYFLCTSAVNTYLFSLAVYTFLNLWMVSSASLLAFMISSKYVDSLVWPDNVYHTVFQNSALVLWYSCDNSHYAVFPAITPCFSNGILGVDQLFMLCFGKWWLYWQYAVSFVLHADSFLPVAKGYLYKFTNRNSSC